MKNIHEKEIFFNSRGFKSPAKRILFILENFFSIAGDLNPLLIEFYFYLEGMNSPSIKRTL